MEDMIFINDTFIQQCYADFITSRIEEKMSLCNFTKPITDSNFEAAIIAPLMQNGENIQYFTGATKGVIKFLNKQYVLKIPFYNKREDIWDKCKKEMELYQKAQNFKVNDFFAPVVLITTIANHPIYFQPYCKTMFECTYKKEVPYFTKQQKQKVLDIFQSYYIYAAININWLTDIYVIYGEEKFKMLMIFLKANNIIDLHEENIGFTASGNPVIIDYYV